MSRLVIITAFLALTLQSSQAQFFSHGVPASVTSPEPDGRQHGVPASVVSPTPLPFGVNPPLRQGVRIQGPLRRFGGPRSHRLVFVPVPVFYSYYTDGAYPSAADPYVSDAQADQAAAPQAPADRSADRNEDELRAAYLQGARDALTQQRDSRYGEHYMDSRERARREAPATTEKKPRSQDDAAVSKPAAEDKSPATVFIFKDGHQLETRNYAIMGETLFDFSDKVLKKIQLNELDAAATTKANDDRGVAVKLQ
jgi:hypothetical protein